MFLQTTARHNSGSPQQKILFRINIAHEKNIFKNKPKHIFQKKIPQNDKKKNEKGNKLNKNNVLNQF